MKKKHLLKPLISTTLSLSMMASIGATAALADDVVPTDPEGTTPIEEETSGTTDPIENAE